MIVISDTTPIITLSKIKRLDLLQKLFKNILIPQAVYSELTSNVQFQNEADAINDAKYIQVVDVYDVKAVELLRRATGLDLGESEAIIFTDNCKAELLLIDEVKGRKVAKQMGLSVMGTLGILMAAYNEKFISSDEIKEYIIVMKKVGRHISDKLYAQLIDLIEK